LRAYLIFAALTFLIATCIFSFRVWRIHRKWPPQVAIWSTLFLGFPLASLIDRGNIEAVIWVLILLGIVAYTRNRMLVSALLWSTAASMKVFPGLLFVLFLARRKFGTFALAIIATAAFSLLALAGIGPTIRQAAADNSKSADFLLNRFILIRNASGFDHSLFNLAKQVIYVNAWAHKNVNDQLAPDTKAANTIAFRLYNIAVPLGALLLYWFRLRRMPILNQFMAYLVLCVLLPYVSSEYTLIHVYLVWGAFLLFLLTDVTSGSIRIPARTIFMILFSCAVVFAPLTYLQIENRAGRTLPFGSQVKTVFLALILWTVVRTPMPSSLFGDLQTLPNNSLPEPASN
jgi:hypothetical protein